MREVTGNKPPRKPKYHGRIKCASCRRWMRPEPDAKTPLRRRPSPLAAWCVECPTGLILASTRSNKNADARRDFDDFDVNEELCRARRALREVSKGEDAERSPGTLLAFAVECFLNIDEWLSRGGDLPSAWQGRFQQRVGAYVDIFSTYVRSKNPHVALALQLPDDNTAKRVTGCVDEAARKAFSDAKGAMPCVCNSGSST